MQSPGQADSLKCRGRTSIPGDMSRRRKCCKDSRKANEIFESRDAGRYAENTGAYKENYNWKKGKKGKTFLKGAMNVLIEEHAFD